MCAQRVAIAGSTGSIGTQTLDVVRAEPGEYEVVALGVGSSIEALIVQANEFRPKLVVVADPTKRAAVASALPFAEVVGDLAALVDDADVVVNGVVGFAGLAVTVATLRAGKRLALANKESLIAAGPVVQPLRSIAGAELVPVDSEHCAVHQCLRSSARPVAELSRIVLTASGGPFRGRTSAELANVGVEQALNHPTWKMGPKITIDSSTLMNKGLEVIEAHELFGTPYDQIDVVVHPQSVIHSMVEFTDGATIAQLSMPDMRLAIGYALAYPNRIATPFGRIDWTTLARLDFEAPDVSTFRCLALAYAAGRVGGSAPAWLSAANEEAVDAFLAGRIRWSQIAEICDAVLQQHHETTDITNMTVDDIVQADALARRIAHEELAR
ncbi:MAG: 1-deoxy-D-xylulose-5-phosphate reductoisomerase [Actinobacteria bacterium]|uniref:1-deoxy-D-xylulose-5-phosphate reductoisomerase n=1 Tax=freshwater metagenome TaxID=449393 RepID=A0A6J6PJW5_9ZZZZ|nr:1-deoxy-D-xylulose-5-phosphate reductoisomerase [Actinomycetota bacterium]